MFSLYLRILSLCVVSTLGISCATFEAGLYNEDEKRSYQVSENIARAEKLWQNGKKTEAITALETLIRQEMRDSDYVKVNFALVRWYLHIGKPALAKKSLKAILMTQPESSYAEQARKMYVEAKDAQLAGSNQIQSQNPNPPSTLSSETSNLPIENEQQSSSYPTVDPALLVHDVDEKASVTVDEKVGAVIGVILPLSGPSAPYGQRVLRALSLGLDIEPQLTEDEAFLIGNSHGITLLVGDSRGDVQQAKSIVQTMILEKKVIGIVGDILSSVTDEIVRICNEQQVPIITFSRKADVVAKNPFALRIGLTAHAQAKELVDYSIDKLSLSRFAVLYPDHAYGEELAQAFASQVKDRGAEVVYFEKYAKDTTTFTPLISKIAPRSYNKDLHEQCMKSLAHIDTAKAANVCKSKMPPRIDFDAIYIPDTPKELNYIIPALLSGDILVSQNPLVVRSFKQSTKFHDAPVIRLLGSNSWRDPLLGEKLKTQVDGAIFIDGLAVGNTNAIMQKFTEKFSETEQSPPSLMDAQAYDIGGMIKSVLSVTDKPQDRATFLKRLKEKNGLQGALGSLNISSDREIVTPLHFLTFSEGKMIDVVQGNDDYEQKAVTEHNGSENQ